MEHIIANEGMGIFTFLGLMGASACLSAYLLLSRGIFASMFSIAVISFCWAKFVGEYPVSATFLSWYFINWIWCYAVIGISGISVLMRKGKIGWFSAVATD